MAGFSYFVFIFVEVLNFILCKIIRGRTLGKKYS